MSSEIIYRLPKWDREADVLVVGYGGAGASAAMAAHDAGAEVLIIKKQPADGVDSSGRITEVRHTPSSRLSGARIYCPTNAKDAFEYQKAMNQVYGTNDVPDDMLKVWAEELVKNFDYLRSLRGG